MKHDVSDIKLLLYYIHKTQTNKQILANTLNGRFKIYNSFESFFLGFCQWCEVKRRSLSANSKTLTNDTPNNDLCITKFYFHVWRKSILGNPGVTHSVPTAFISPR